MQVHARESWECILGNLSLNSAVSITHKTIQVSVMSTRQKQQCHSRSHGDGKEKAASMLIILGTGFNLT